MQYTGSDGENCPSFIFAHFTKEKKLKGGRNHLLLLVFRVINGTTKKGKETEKTCRLRL